MPQTVKLTQPPPPWQRGTDRGTNGSKFPNPSGFKGKNNVDQSGGDVKKFNQSTSSKVTYSNSLANTVPSNKLSSTI